MLSLDLSLNKGEIPKNRTIFTSLFWIINKDIWSVLRDAPTFPRPPTHAASLQAKERK